MPIRTRRWPTGVPCWVDLTVSDVPAALAFYGAVLSWEFVEDTAGDFGGYAIAQVQGHAAAGIGPAQQIGVPPAWTLYLAADDADRTAKEVTDAGGTMLLPPGDAGPLGRWFVAADPTGAVFGVWQAAEHLGAEWHSDAGGLTWEDLRSPDPAAAIAFYRTVFGYETQDLPGAGPDYATFTLAGASDQAPLGGMGPLFGSPRARWLVYFGVRDLDAALGAARARGAMEVAAPTDSPYGRMALVQDPFGAEFMLAETDGSQPPPER